MININDEIVADLSGNDYLEAYLRREFPAHDPDDEPRTPVAGVKVVTDDTEGADDAEFDAYCREQALPVVVLRCPQIVATGMGGLTRRIAESIYRGRFVHIRGNEARLSVVHGVDVARAAHIAAGCQATFTLTDCVDPTVHDLAEALAYRIDNKRLITLPPRLARLWLGRRFFDTLTSGATARCTFVEAFPDFHPVSVTEYLKTHVYDENSL